jgi:hypothetical protein
LLIVPTIFDPSIIIFEPSKFGADKLLISSLSWIKTGFGSNTFTLIVAGDAESNSDVITPSVVVKPIFHQYYYRMNSQ